MSVGAAIAVTTVITVGVIAAGIAVTADRYGLKELSA